MTSNDAWELFKKTGEIKYFLKYKEVKKKED